MKPDLYVSADEAAGMLGISADTLYAYVSRKKIRSFAIAGSRKRRYWRADVLALASGGKSQGSPGDRGFETTAITLRTENGIFYRGKNVVELAADCTLEAIAGLLWEVDPAAAFTSRLPRPASAQDRLVKALSGVGAQDRALALLPLIERSNPRAFDLSPEGFSESGADVLRWVTAILLGLDAPSTDPIHSVIARGAGVSDAIGDLIRRAMVLVADHELNDTTRAVRAAARTGITPYGAVVVGLISSAGQSLRVNRTEAARRMVLELIGSAHPEDAIIARYRAGEPIPGMITGIDRPHRDTRTEDLMTATRAAFAGDVEFERLDRAITLASELSKGPASILLPLLFLGHKVSPPGDAMAIPMIARATGWIAHALEIVQMQDARRASASYIGPLPYADPV